MDVDSALIAGQDGIPGKAEIEDNVWKLACYTRDIASPFESPRPVPSRVKPLMQSMVLSTNK